MLLLVIMIGSTVWSIDQARWVEGTGILFPLAFAGLLAGLGLARTKMAGPVGILLGLVLGCVLVFVAVGQLVPPPQEILGALGQTIGGTVAWIGRPSGPPPLWAAIQQFISGAAEFGA